VIFVHGGGGQGTAWLTTPDGRPGWARAFVADGFACYVVDRPGHGRSAQTAQVFGPIGAQGTAQQTAILFAAADAATGQTQWPWSRRSDSAELAQLTAANSPLLTDLAEVNRIDAARLAALLDLTGPAIVVSHSLGSIGVWTAAHLRPELVRVIVAIEPAGPPFATIPGVGSLAAGITALTWDADENGVPGISGVPIVVVSGSASRFRSGAVAVRDFLRDECGASVELLALEDIGLIGNGHGLMFEQNSDEAAGAVIRWLDSHVPAGTSGVMDAHADGLDEA
jgi:pimeloyl-ACP methyl ester carboxylesterase